MTILTNNKDRRTIEFSISDIIHEEENDGKTKYAAVLPFVVCNHKQDAKYIQEKVNRYINRISRELLK